MARDLHDDFYKRLRKRLTKWARTKEGRTSEATEYVLLAPDLFHLLVRLSLDPDVSLVDKAKVGAALAYFLSPIDLLPEAVVGPLGYLDDVAIGVLAVHSVLEKAGPLVVSRHWAGDQDIMEATRRFLDRADDLLGRGLWARVQGVMDRTGSSKDLQSAKGRATAKATAKPKAVKKAAPRKTAKKAARKRCAKRAAKRPANSGA